MLILAILLLAVPAQAEKSEGTETLEWGDHIDIRIDFDAGDIHKIKYEVKVIEGAPVNIFFLTSTGYNQYTSPLAWEFSYYVNESSLNTKNVEKDFTWDDQGTYYIVIENTHYTLRNSTVEYTVSWESHSSTEGDFWYVLGGLIVFFIALGIFRIIRDKRAMFGPPERPPPPPGYQPMPGHQPSYAPPYQPPYPPSQQPQPPDDQYWPPPGQQNPPYP